MSGTRMSKTFDGRCVTTIVRIRPIREANRDPGAPRSPQIYSPRRKSCYGFGEFLAWLLERTNFSTTKSKRSFAVLRTKHCATAEWTTKHRVTFIKPRSRSAEAVQ
jgi:hypothetical protein